MFGGLFGRCTGPPGPLNRTSDTGNSGPFTSLLLVVSCSPGLLLVPAAWLLESSWFGKASWMVLCSKMKIHDGWTKEIWWCNFWCFQFFWQFYWCFHMFSHVFQSFWPGFWWINGSVLVEIYKFWSNLDGKIYVLVQFYWKIDVFGEKMEVFAGKNESFGAGFGCFFVEKLEFVMEKWEFWSSFGWKTGVTYRHPLR